MNKLILASNSPRRKEILEIFSKDFIQLSPSSSEVYDPNFDIKTNIMSIARKKARSVAKNYPDHIVLATDTIVYKDGKILGKAKDEDEARDFLEALSGSVHEVISGFCLEAYRKDLSVVDYQISKVVFKKLDEDDIENYITSGEWKDKAGGYGIQGKGTVLVDSIEGDYFNIVGLPIAKLYRYLKKYFNINLLEV